MRKALVWQDCGRKSALFAHTSVSSGAPSVQRRKSRSVNGRRAVSMVMPHSAFRTAPRSLLLLPLFARCTVRTWLATLWTCDGLAALRARPALIRRRRFSRLFGLWLVRMLGIELEGSTRLVRLGRLAHHLELVDAGFSSVAGFGDLRYPDGIENRLAHVFERAPPTISASDVSRTLPTGHCLAMTHV